MSIIPGTFITRSIVDFNRCLYAGHPFFRFRLSFQSVQ